MSSSLIMLTSVVTMSLAGRENHRQDGNDVNDVNDINDSNDLSDSDIPPPAHGRLVINAAVTSVDMFRLSSALETISIMDDNVALEIYPLFVCPGTVCPDGRCPPRKNLTASGCVTNNNPAPRVVPLQVGSPTSLLDFVVHTANPVVRDTAFHRILNAISRNELAAHHVTKLQNYKFEVKHDDDDEEHYDDDTNDMSEPDVNQETIRTYVQIAASPSNILFNKLREILLLSANKNEKLVRDVSVLYACPAVSCNSFGCLASPELRYDAGCIEGQSPSRDVSAKQSELSIVEYVLTLEEDADLMKAVDNIALDIAADSLSGTGPFSDAKVTSILVIYGDDDDDDDDATDSDENRKLAIIIGSSAAGVVAICVLVFSLYVCCCRTTDKVENCDIESPTPSEIRAESKNKELELEEIPQVPVSVKKNDPY